MHTLRVLILTGLVLSQSCKTPETHSSDVKLQAGTYKDAGGKRKLIVTYGNHDQLRIEITAKDAQDRFVDLTATPKTLDAKVIQLQGRNQITGNQETLNIVLRGQGQLQVERVEVPFPETILFRK